jgi:competence ComEA-like helix-hairpin-helix protein
MSLTVRSAARPLAVLLCLASLAAGPRVFATPAPATLPAEPSVAPTSPAGDGVVNLNTATADELQRLPRIGEGKALAIIAHRERTPFKSTAELGRVKGIGLKTLRLLKPWLAVSGPTTLREKVRAPAARRGGRGEAGAPLIL